MDEFFQGRDAIVDFLQRKWGRELDYRLRRSSGASPVIASPAASSYESRDRDGQWWPSHGNEHWEFDDNGLMRRRDASINDYKIAPEERRIDSGE